MYIKITKLNQLTPKIPNPKLICSCNKLKDTIKFLSANQRPLCTTELIFDKRTKKKRVQYHENYGTLENFSRCCQINFLLSGTQMTCFVSPHCGPARHQVCCFQKEKLSSLTVSLPPSCLDHKANGMNSTEK